MAVTAVTIRGHRRLGQGRFGPADAVTYVRALLSCVAAGFVVEAARTGTTPGALSPLAATALLLDAVDGPLARRTGTASAFGARFDGEADALLILVLSLHAARDHGAWVALGGIARYAFGAAGITWPWLRRPLPFRYWRKVATAVEGIALVGATRARAPRPVRIAGLAAGTALIGESFGRDVLWLWRRRREPMPPRANGTTP